LHTLLPRLQERLQQIQAAEYATRWEADFEQVEGRRNELVQEAARQEESRRAHEANLRR
jgi:hypothetical protein